MLGRGRLIIILNHYFAELLWNGDISFKTEDNGKEQKRFKVVNDLWKKDPTKRELMYDFLITELGFIEDKCSKIFKDRVDVKSFNYTDVEIGATHTLDEKTPLFIFYPELRSLCNDLKKYKLGVGSYTIPKGLNAETEYHLRTILDGMVRITNLAQGTYGASAEVATQLYRRLFSNTYSTLSLDIEGAMRIGEVWKEMDNIAIKGLMRDYDKYSVEMMNYADAVYNGRWIDLLKIYGEYDMPTAKMVSEILMPKYRGDMFSKDIRHMEVDWANFVGMNFIEPDEMKKHYKYMMNGTLPNNWKGDIGWSNFTMPYFTRGAKGKDFFIGNYYYPPMPYHFENANMRVIQQLVVNYSVGISPEQQVSGCYNISVLTKLLCDKFGVKSRLRCGWCDLSGRYYTPPDDRDDPSIYWSLDYSKMGERNHRATHFWVDVDIGEGWEICDFRLQKCRTNDSSVSISAGDDISEDIAMESQDYIMIGRKHSKSCYDLPSPNNIKDLEKNRENFNDLSAEYYKGSWVKVCEFIFSKNTFGEYCEQIGGVEIVKCVETQKMIDTMENPYIDKIYKIKAEIEQKAAEEKKRNTRMMAEDAVKVRELRKIADRDEWDKKHKCGNYTEKKKAKVLTEEEQIEKTRKKKEKRARQKAKKASA